MVIDNTKVIVLTEDDKYIALTDWQLKYGLPVGSTMIGLCFSYEESKFQQDLKDYGKLIVCAPLIKVIDKYRELIRESVTINSFNRSAQKQEQLRLAGFRAAKTSPHEEKMAADCDTVSESDTLKKKEKMLEAGSLLKIPIRVGFQQYLDNDPQQTFIHVDVCPLYYAPGRPRHSDPHPIQWEKQITW